MSVCGPTVGDLVKPILEVHLLDFKGDLYGQRIAVEFVHKIRDEQKFTGIEQAGCHDYARCRDDSAVVFAG